MLTVTDLEAYDCFCNRVLNGSSVMPVSSATSRTADVSKDSPASTWPPGKHQHGVSPGLSRYPSSTLPSGRITIAPTPIP
ncbi:MAG: hypothetical protein VYA65_04830 [Pseudomonadota bacterium]|nr:hypothetical protein [Pseudomonadota bacterium]